MELVEVRISIPDGATILIQKRGKVKLCMPGEPEVARTRKSYAERIPSFGSVDVWGLEVKKKLAEFRTFADFMHRLNLDN